MSSHKDTTAKVTVAKGPGKLTVKDGNAKTTMLSDSARKTTKEATAVLNGTTDKVTPNGK
jgi:hypothetical protein